MYTITYNGSRVEKQPVSLFMHTLNSALFHSFGFSVIFVNTLTG